MASVTNKQNTKNSFVRISLDESLSEAILLIQKEYPLLSTAEAVKLILSRGLKSSQPSLAQILSNFKLTNPVQTDLDEDGMFAEWEKFKNSK